MGEFGDKFQSYSWVVFLLELHAQVEVTTIIVHIRRALNGQVWSIVVGGGCQGKIISLVGLSLIDVEVQEMFYGCIGLFCLTICLRMICSRGVGFNAQ